MTTTDLERQWDDLLRQELRKTKSIIVALSRCRQRHPQLWAELNAPRTEQRAEAMAEERQSIERVERQR